MLYNYGLKSYLRARSILKSDQIALHQVQLPLLTLPILNLGRTTYFLRSSWQSHRDSAVSCTYF